MEPVHTINLILSIINNPVKGIFQPKLKMYPLTTDFWQFLWSIDSSLCVFWNKYKEKYIDHHFKRVSNSLSTQHFWSFITDRISCPRQDQNITNFFWLMYYSVWKTLCSSLSQSEVAFSNLAGKKVAVFTDGALVLAAIDILAANVMLTC